MIKAIETQYKGYRFRSRLEARWAVFFDALGIQWEYEPEGFDLGKVGWYLPDFKTISRCGLATWWEVKPNHITSDGKVEAFRASLRALQGEGEYNIAICFQQVNFVNGDPVETLKNKAICPRCYVASSSGRLSFMGTENFGEYSHSEFMDYCWACDETTPWGGNHPVEYDALVPYRPHKGMLIFEKDDWRKLEEIVHHAAHAARAARFEHGETP